MNTVVEVEVDGEVIEIKSKRDDRHVSGWSVIAFTPSCSIRSIKCHRPDLREAFTDAIVASVTEEPTDEERNAVNAAILSIIDLG